MNPEPPDQNNLIGGCLNGCAIMVVAFGVPVIVFLVIMLAVR